MLSKKELEEIKKQIDREEKMVMKHRNNVKRLKQHLVDNCDHSVFTEYREYNEGGYLDRASTTIRVKCNICDKLLDMKEKVHDWYG